MKELSSATFEQITHAINNNGDEVLPLMEFSRQHAMFSSDLYEMWFIALVGKNFFTHQLLNFLTYHEMFGIDEDKLDLIVNRQLHAINFLSMDSNRISDIFSMLAHIISSEAILDEKSVANIQNFKSFDFQVFLDKNKENIAFRLQSRLNCSLEDKAEIKKIKI